MWSNLQFEITIKKGTRDTGVSHGILQRLIYLSFLAVNLAVRNCIRAPPPDTKLLQRVKVAFSPSFSSPIYSILQNHWRAVQCASVKRDTRQECAQDLPKSSNAMMLDKGASRVEQMHAEHGTLRMQRPMQGSIYLDAYCAMPPVRAICIAELLSM